MKQIHGTETENWSLRVEDNFTVIEYDGEISPEEGKAIVEEWTPLISDESVDTHVLVLEAEDHFDKETFGTVEQAGELGLQHGVDRWAIVASRAKSMAIGSQLPDAIETYTTEEVDDALDWARN